MADSGCTCGHCDECLFRGTEREQYIRARPLLTPRPSPERLARIRRYVAEECSGYSVAAALLAEVDALNKERDDKTHFAFVSGALWAQRVANADADAIGVAAATYHRWGHPDVNEVKVIPHERPTEDSDGVR